MGTKKVIRTFEYDGDKYELIEPNAKINREARLKYSIAFTEGIKQGLYVRKSLEKKLREADEHIFSEYVKLRSDLIKRIAEAEQSLEDVTNADINDPEQYEVLAQIVSVYRAQLLEEDQLMNSLFDSTADNMAEEERINYMAYCMVRKEKDKKQLSDSYDTYLEEVDSLLIDECKMHVLYWEYKLDPNWHENLPETEALKHADKLREEQEKVEEKKVEEEKKEETVEDSEKKKKPTKKTAPKKRTAKKTTATSKKRGKKPKAKSGAK